MTAHSRTGAGNTKEYVAEMLKKCEQGVEACRTSEGFLQYLKAQAKFHNYSYNNSMLIASQMPEATYVAGYRSWQAFSTPDNPVYVRKGEKAIYILAPAPYKKTVEVTDADGNAVLNPDGSAKTEERIVQSFRPTYVFDISQVEGIDESVLNPCKILEGEVKEYELLRTAIESVSDAPIDYITIKQIKMLSKRK